MEKLHIGYCIVNRVSGSL